jgi:hypothetical protein
MNDQQMPPWLREATMPGSLQAACASEMPGWLRNAQDPAYSRHGYPQWLKLTSRSWAVYEMAGDIQRRREAAWERNAADRDHALRLWRETTARLGGSAPRPAPRPAGLRYAMVAGRWWEKPQRPVIM